MASSVAARPKFWKVNGRKWLFLTLATCLRLNSSIEEIATFLRQSRREVRDKIADLERSGDLSRLVERAAGTTVDEPDAMGFGEEDREPIAPERAKQQPQPG